MAQPIDIKVTLDLPDGVEFLGYERVGDGHGIEVKFPLPDVCQCDTCGRKEPATYEYKNTVYMVRHLDLFGQPCFLVFQPCFHRCSRCRNAKADTLILSTDFVAGCSVLAVGVTGWPSICRA
ncbi:MAG: hypothetical protein ACOC7K_01535 [bacterium]